jgi:hypothetical protein
MTQDRWAYFAHIHAKADSNILNDTNWAIDEALDDLLNRISDGRFVPNEQQLDDFIGNRRRKYRRRRQALEADQLVTRVDHIHPSAIARLEIIDAVAPLADSEIKSLLSLATGRSYGELASEMKRPIGSVKASVHRARMKLAA